MTVARFITKSMSCHLLALASIMSEADLKSRGASLNETVLAKFPMVVPDSVKFPQSKKILQAKRTAVKIRAENQTYASNNNRQMRILFPNNALYDLRSGYVTCDMTITTTGGTYRRLHYGSFSALERLHILFGSAEIEDQRDYNRLQSIVWMSSVLPEITSSMGINMGFGTQGQRNVWATGQNMVIPLYSGVLNSCLWPTHAINGGMIIELYIADPTTCVETDGTVPIITISNLMLHVERLELDPAYMGFVKSWIGAHGLQIGYPCYERYVNALSTGSQQNVTINNKNSSVDGFYNIFVNSATISNTTVFDKFINWTNPGLTQYNMLVNGTIYPDEPIDAVTNNSQECYQIYCRSMGKWKLNGQVSQWPAIPAQYFPQNQFLFIIDMEPFPEMVVDGDSLITPFTTIGNSGTIILNLTFSGVIAANLQVDTWVRYFKQVAIYGNGSVRVLQ